MPTYFRQFDMFNQISRYLGDLHVLFLYKQLCPKTATSDFYRKKGWFQKIFINSETPQKCYVTALRCNCSEIKCIDLS